MKEILNEIINSKWEEIMPTIPNDFVDIIITSPPYNISLGHKKTKNKYDNYEDNLKYEDYLNWMTSFFYECNRVLKYGGRLCINIADGANGSIPTHIDLSHRALNLFDKHNKEDHPFRMITTIVWDKGQMGSSTSWGSFQSPSCPSFPTQFEFILIFGKGTKKLQKNGETSVSKENFIKNSRALWKFPPETLMTKEYQHPAMFPEELPRRLIDQLTYVNDIVLDPFSGVGTTCVVAKKMERQYIGIEPSLKYHKKSIERLSLIPNLKNNIPNWIV